MESEDFVVAGLRFANSALGSVTATTALYPGGSESIELGFEHASARLCAGELTVHHRTGDVESLGEPATTGGGADPMAFPHDWHLSLIGDFVEAVQTGRPPAVTGREALQVHRLIDAWWTEGEPGTVDGFIKRFPGIPRVASRDVLLDNPDIDLVIIADIPAMRAARAIEAMRAGKDVMTDKPGCTTPAQLAKLRDVQRDTGRIWSIDFSERFEVPAVQRAAELVRAGAIGRVIQTVGLGPHRLNAATRPDWFFQRDQYGGILCDKLRQSGAPATRRLRRSRAPQCQRPRLHPRRLVYARRLANLG